MPLCYRFQAGLQEKRIASSSTIKNRDDEVQLMDRQMLAEKEATPTVSIGSYDLDIEQVIIEVSDMVMVIWEIR